MFLYVSQNGQKIPTDEKYVEKTATTDSKNRVPTPAAESHAERTLSTENKNRSRSQALVEKVTRGTVLYERTPLHIHTKKTPTPYTTILQIASRGFVSDSWAFLFSLSVLLSLSLSICFLNILLIADVSVREAGSK